MDLDPRWRRAGHGGAARAALSVAFPGAAPTDTGGPHGRPPRRGPAARRRRFPDGRLGPEAFRVRRLARRRRAVVVAGAAADPARPPRLPLREPAPPSRLARPAGAPAGRGERRPRSPTSASATPTGSTTGPASPAAARCAEDQVRFDREWGSLRDHAADRGVRIMGDLPFYVAPRGADVRAHPGLFRRDAVAGRPPGRLHGRRPALGQPHLRLGGHARGRLPLVDRAPAPLPRAGSTPLTHRPLPGLRGLVGGAAAARAPRAAGAGGAGPGTRWC